MNKIKIKRKDDIYYIKADIKLNANNKEQFDSKLIKEFESALTKEFAYNHEMNKCKQIHISKKNHNKIFTEHKIGLHDNYEYYICDDCVQINKFYNWVFIVTRLFKLIFNDNYNMLLNREYRERYFDTLIYQKKYMQYFQYKFDKNSEEYRKVKNLMGGVKNRKRI